MIRSSIGIVCVLVFITTCAQSTAAQARGESTLSDLRGRGLQSQLSNWVELAEQGISDRILSSDAYHDKFRFRASPVKQSRNWKMPIVDVRPAKDISITFNQPRGPRPTVAKAAPSRGDNRAPVFNWVWQSSSDLAVRYCELDDPLDQVPQVIFPRPLPSQAKKAQAKLLKLKLVKVKAAKKGPAEPKRPMTTGRKDYWDYYGDCDRWDVVFAIPAKTSPVEIANSQPAVESAAPENADQERSEITVALEDLAALIADRWETAISFCRTVSRQFLASR